MGQGHIDDKKSETSQARRGVYKKKFQKPFHEYFVPQTHYLGNCHRNDGVEEAARHDSKEVHTRRDHRKSFHGDLVPFYPDELSNDRHESHHRRTVVHRTRLSNLFLGP